MYKTLDFVKNKRITETQYKVEDHVKLKDLKVELLKAALKLINVVKDRYKDDVRVSLYYEDLFSDIENKSFNEINQFLKDSSDFKE